MTGTLAISPEKRPYVYTLHFLALPVGSKLGPIS